MKQTAMLVVSLRGVNFGFWSRLGCPRHSTNILRCQETRNYTKRNRSQIFFLTCFVFVFVCFKAVSVRGQNLQKRQPDWSPLGVKFKISDEHLCLLHMGVPPLLYFRHEKIKKLVFLALARQYYVEM